MNPARRLGLLLLFAFAIGCGASAKQQTLHAALVTVDAASVAFVEVNKTKLDAIVARPTPPGPEGYRQDMEAIAAWEAKSDPVLNSIRLAYRLIAAAALGKDASLEDVLVTVAGLMDDINKLRGEP